ncbi:MAG: YhdP family protein [Micavibrio sp.]
MNDKPHKKRKAFRFGRRTALIVIESLMVLAGLLLVGGGVLVWRLNEGPIEVGFARKYIESELSDPAHDLTLALGSVYLEWSALEARPQITLKDVRLINTKKDRLAFAFESASVSLSRGGLLLGQIVPRTIIVNRPLIALIREADNSIRLGFGQSLPEDGGEDYGDLFQILDDLARPAADAPKDWPLRNLRMIMITDARMMVEDHVLDQSWLVPKIEVAFQKRNKNLGLTAALWLEDAQAKDPTLKAEAIYNGTGKSITADIAVNNLRAPFIATKLPSLDWLKGQAVVLNGKAQVQLDAGLVLTQVDATLESRDGQIMVPDIYDRPLNYKSLNFSMAYNDAQKTFTLKDSNIVLAEDFSFSLTGAVTQKEDSSIHAPVKLFLHSLPQSRIPEFWPSVMKGKSAEDWALNRLSEGRLYNSTIDAVIDARKTVIEGRDDWAVDLTSMTMDFFIENMTVDYSKPLMPVRQADGHGVYDYATDRMTIDVQKGLLGEMNLKNGKIVIDTVYGDAVGHARINADLDGPLKTIFRYIAAEPIGVTDVPTDVDRVEGNAKLKIDISFPTLADLPAEKIVVAAEGTADNVFMPDVVNGLDLRGGPVAVKIKDGRVDVTGKGTLEGRDTSFTYVQFFESEGKPYSGQVVADILVDPALRESFGMDLSDWLDGSVPAKVTYTEFGGGSNRAEVLAVVDATPGTLMVKPMNYAKPPGVAAKASFKATLDGGFLKTIENLSVETPDLKAEGGQMGFAQSGTETLLKSGRFAKARLKETDVAIDFTISNTNLLNIALKGSFLDGTPFLENNKKGGAYDGPALIATVDVARVRTAEARLINNVKLYVDMDNKGSLQKLEMDALVGKGKIYFRYKPDATAQKMILRIESDDAGAALQAFDVYENVRGGTMLISGESVVGGNPKIIVGKAELGNFLVVNAPVLARLVNALSLPGIMQLLGSDGISFTRLEADFNWEMKSGGDLFSFRNGRTAGSSMGLTFEGNVDRAQDTININGTIVPVSLVNDILGSIPLVGDILSGGSAGGVFAATYSVRGPAKNPTTMVNPLAVLTPGFLRRIFFE